MKKAVLLSTLYFSIQLLSSQISIQWEKSFGGSYSDKAFSMVQNFDSSFVIAGYVSSSDGEAPINSMGEDFWVFKTDKNGNISWNNAYGGNGNERAYSIKQTSDSGYIIVGYTESNSGIVSGNHGKKDYWVLKLTKTGAVTFSKCFGGSDDDIAKDVVQTLDGGYIVVGQTSSNSFSGDVSLNNGYDDIWIIKLNSAGSLMWQKSYGGSNYDRVNNIKAANSDNFIVTGTSSNSNLVFNSNKGYFDAWFFKINNTGNILWAKSIGGSNHDEILQLDVNSSFEIALAGYSLSSDFSFNTNKGLADGWIAKADSAGNILWIKSLGGEQYDEFTSVRFTKDQGLVVAGFTPSATEVVVPQIGSTDAWVVKYDKFGAQVWQNRFGKKDAITEIYSCIPLSDSVFQICGSQYLDPTQSNRNEDVWLAKIGPKFASEINSFQPLNIYSFTSRNNNLYIKRTENLLIDSYHIFSIIGQEIATGALKDNLNTIDISALNRGIYFLHIDNSSQVYKFLKE